MSKAEILVEIPKLTPEERYEIRQKIDELDDELSAEELSLIDTRIREHDADPRSAISWEEAKTLIRDRIVR